MKLSNYFPFLFGLLGFPIQVIIGNAFDFLYFNLFFHEEKPNIKILGTICKVGDFQNQFLVYLLLSFSVLFLLFFLTLLIKNKPFILLCASYFVFLSFAFFILPLPNYQVLFYLRALFLSSSFIQFASYYAVGNFFLFYLIPLLLAVIILKRIKLSKVHLQSFLLGCLSSLLGSFLFFYGMSLLRYM